MAPKHDLSFWRTINKQHKNDSLRWIGTTPDLPLRAIEAWRYGKTNRLKQTPRHTEKRYHVFQDDEVVDWLKNPITPEIASAGDVGQLTGHIRVVVCHEIPAGAERRQTDPYRSRYMMGLDTVQAVENGLNLPGHAFHSLASIWGVETGDFEVETNVKEIDPEYISLDITIKTPAVTDELPYCGLALSYNFETSTTTAFVRGLNGVVKDVTNINLTLADRFNIDLELTPHLWRHPLLLPVILMRHHLTNIRELARVRLQFGSDTIRSRLQVNNYEEISALLGGNNDDPEAKRKRVAFTNEISDTYLTAIYVRRSLKSARRTVKFLLGLLQELDEVQDKITTKRNQPLLKLMNKNESRSIRDIIRSIDSTFAGFETGVDAIISTLDVQLNVLSTVASQLDNVRSTQIATEAGLDSVALKALALVTIIFLPATFIATLFSISMFNWQADAQTPLLSSYFWIFWAVSIPLTLVVLAAWWVWWNVMKYYYVKRFADAESGATVTKMKAFVAWVKDLKHQTTTISLNDVSNIDEDHVSGLIPRSPTSRMEAAMTETDHK